MLKSLIQFFAEKFLLSRSDWISYQSNPPSTAIHLTPVQTGEWVTVISPCNGWFCVKAAASNILLSNGELWQGIHQDTPHFKGFSLPVSKGWAIAYQLSTDATGAFVFFVSSIGNRS